MKTLNDVINAGKTLLPPCTRQSDNSIYITTVLEDTSHIDGRTVNRLFVLTYQKTAVGEDYQWELIDAQMKLPAEAADA